MGVERLGASSSDRILNSTETHTVWMRKEAGFSPNEKEARGGAQKLVIKGSPQDLSPWLPPCVHIKMSLVLGVISSYRT